ncbi:MAG: hypothetical protein ABIW79_10280 [Gemmatimonas sp.]
MLLSAILVFVVFAGGSFAVQRTSRTAEKPGRWSRNGLLGIGTISTLLMVGLVAGGWSTLGFLMLAVWLPAMVAGILVERITYKPAGR